MARQTFTLEQIMEADNEGIGFCVDCGAEREYCEPDARKYGCEECQKYTVYGAQEILIMGLVK